MKWKEKNIVKDNVVPSPYHEGVWGSGCVDLCFLDLATSWD
jgi:hypothetical protein